MKSFIIPLFIPHEGCPHQCVFCNQTNITGQTKPVAAAAVAATIAAGLDRLTQKRRVEVAFYGGSFTALPLSLQAKLLQPAYLALQSGRVDGIRLSPRPDCLSGGVLDLLRRFGVATVEIGVQSFDDAVLRQSGRGHSAADAAAALASLHAAGFSTVAQLMIGLPGESWDSLLATAAALERIRPQAVRIYPTLVLADTPLAALYRSGDYRPLSMEEAVAKAAFLKWQAERLGITVIRTGLQATDELDQAGTILAGPYHPAFGEMVASHLFYLMAARVFELAVQDCQQAIFYHHPKDHSKLRGLGGANLRRWQREYGIRVSCRSDAAIAAGELLIDYNGVKYQTRPSVLSEV